MLMLEFNNNMDALGVFNILGGTSNFKVVGNKIIINTDDFSEEKRLYTEVLEAARDFGCKVKLGDYYVRKNN